MSDIAEICLVFFQFSSKKSSIISGVYEAETAILAADKWANDKFGLNYVDALMAEKINSSDIVITAITAKN